MCKHKLIMEELVTESVNRNFAITQCELNYYAVIAEANENKFEEN